MIRPLRSRNLLDVAPTDLRLAWTAEALAGRPKKEDLLRRGLKQVAGNYDVVVTDSNVDRELVEELSDAGPRVVLA